MMPNPVKDQDPAIKQSPILPRRHGHVVEETEAEGLQGVILNELICFLIDYKPWLFQHDGQAVLQAPAHSLRRENVQILQKNVNYCKQSI